MHTGELCERAGTYRSTCCDQDIQVSKGRDFPVCPDCSQPAVWVMVNLFTSKN